MASFSEARPRLATLDALAVSALRVSPITLKTYTRPHGFLALVFIAACLALLSLPRRANFQNPSLLHTLLQQLGGSWGEIFAAICYKLQPFILYPLVTLHISEAVYMSRSRLRRYNVPQFSALWWKWVGSTFIEGYGAFVRVDALVNKEEEKRSKARH
ncbi:MAG: hypothetical protein Q9200_007178 [Gallowayella weberi]